MIQQVAFFLCTLFLSATLTAQESDYFLQIQVFYAQSGDQSFQPAGTYYGQFDREPSNVVLNSLTLSRAPRQIQLRLSFYSKRGLITPDEVIINGQTAANPGDISYTIPNPSSWPGQKPLTISLFSNWPALDHWIDIPIAWDGQKPFPVATGTPSSYSEGGALTVKGGGARPAGTQTMMLSPGHAVQVATSNKAPGAEKLATFGTFGTVYYISEPPFYKIRVGTFPTKQAALEQLGAIRRFQNGAYADAFYLYEDQSRPVLTTPAPGTAVPQDYDAAADTGARGITDRSADLRARTPLPYDAGSAGPGRVLYENPGISIQLSVHANPPDLSAYSYLSDLGNVYLLRDNDVYRLCVGPFPSKEAAEKVMPQIQAAGFTYAFIRIP